jgi:hypothetical protein
MYRRNHLLGGKMTISGYAAILVVLAAVALAWREMRRRDRLWKEKNQRKERMRLEKMCGEQIRARLEDANRGGIYEVSQFWVEGCGYDLQVSKPWGQSGPVFRINIRGARPKEKGIETSLGSGEAPHPYPLTDEGMDAAVKEAIIFMAEQAHVVVH